jgi:hypothetical protein
MQLTQCPEAGCDSPSEIMDRFVLPSTDGGIEFVQTVCLYRHWFMLPVSSLKPIPTPAPRQAATRAGKRAWQRE